MSGNGNNRPGAHTPESSIDTSFPTENGATLSEQRMYILPPPPPGMTDEEYAKRLGETMKATPTLPPPQAAEKVIRKAEEERVERAALMEAGAYIERDNGGVGWVYQRTPGGLELRMPLYIFPELMDREAAKIEAPSLLDGTEQKKRDIERIHAAQFGTKILRYCIAEVTRQGTHRVKIAKADLVRNLTTDPDDKNIYAEIRRAIAAIEQRGWRSHGKPQGKGKRHFIPTGQGPLITFFGEDRYSYTIELSKDLLGVVATMADPAFKELPEKEQRKRLLGGCGYYPFYPELNTLVEGYSPQRL